MVVYGTWVPIEGSRPSTRPEIRLGNATEMTHKTNLHTNHNRPLIYAAGTQVVTQKQLQSGFESSFQVTRLPDRPDYERANSFLIDARRRAIESHLP